MRAPARSGRGIGSPECWKWREMGECGTGKTVDSRWGPVMLGVMGVVRWSVGDWRSGEAVQRVKRERRGMKRQSN